MVGAPGRLEGPDHRTLSHRYGVPMIRIEGLTVVYGRTLALDSLNIELRPGITGVFGQNGAGKSTLLRTIAGLLRPVRGRVSIDGSIIRLGDESFRQKIAYVGHDSGLYGDLTVAENLKLFATLYGAPVERVASTLASVGLEDRASARVQELSAGLKRRAAVAKALVHDPKVLLLDEPYANLDDGAAAQLSDALLRWQTAERCAVIATHGAKRVKAFATASLILQRGRAVSYSLRAPAER
ncbi:MAG: heme ABC exporter ATP-binding protein CcmA [Actinomycetota bacterium]